MDPVILGEIEMMLLLVFILLCKVAITQEEKIREARPGLAKPITMVVRILMILCVYLIRSISLGILNIVEPDVDDSWIAVDDYSWIITSIGYVYYLIIGIEMLRCVYDLSIILGSCCSRPMAKLMHRATFILTSIGAKSPEGYAIFSYQMDREMGFGEAECAICLMEYETKEKCALLEKCGHTFHFKCLYENLAVSTRCPLYRRSIKYKYTRCLPDFMYL